MKKAKIEVIPPIKPSLGSYDVCPICGFPLSPSNVTIIEGIFRNMVIKGKECMGCGYKIINYTYGGQ